ncbi:MAG: GAF domain-containing protein, partial [Betaproteobacteria bacterium]
MAERTTELEAAKAQAAQLSAGLAVINSIQLGMAAALGFQDVVELVGDKLRDVLKTGDIGILWDEPRRGELRLVNVYGYEHGVRLPRNRAFDITPGGAWETMARTRKGLILNTQQDKDAIGMKAAPGTDESLCSMSAPIIGSDRMLGRITVENHQRDNAYGETDLRLLETVAAAMGVALENARLFDETQRLLRETEQRNAELAVINSIQQAVGAALDFQAIVDVVGDKLREVFATGDMSIRWWDETTDLVHV